VRLARRGEKGMYPSSTFRGNVDDLRGRRSSGQAWRSTRALGEGPKKEVLD